MVTQGEMLPASPSSMRRWNEYVVLSALTDTPRRISELAKLTRLTAPALGEVLQGLQEKGWASSSEPTTPGRGRPAQLFSRSHPAGCVVGVDIGAHAIRIVALDLGGKELGQREHQLSKAAHANERKKTADKIFQQLVTSLENPPVWLTVITLPGHVSEEGKIIDSVVTPEWVGSYPSDIFKEIFPSPIISFNDVRAATWAEHNIGAAQNHDDVLFVKLGRRPSLGTLVNGKPQLGAHGIAGDFSRNSLLPSEENMDWLSSVPQEDPLGQTIADALAGQESALRRVRDYLESITPALILAIAVVDPAVFVLGGALAPLSPAYLLDLTHRIEKEIAQPPHVVASTLDQFASATGGALIGIQKIHDTLVSPDTGATAFIRDNLGKISTHR